MWSEEYLNYAVEGELSHFLSISEIDVILDEGQIDDFCFRFFLARFVIYFVGQVDGRVVGGWFPEVAFVVDDASRLQSVLFSEVNGDDFRLLCCVDVEVFADSSRRHALLCTFRGGFHAAA